MKILEDGAAAFGVDLAGAFVNCSAIWEGRNMSVPWIGRGGAGQCDDETPGAARRRSLIGLDSLSIGSDQVELRRVKNVASFSPRVPVVLATLELVDLYGNVAEFDSETLCYLAVIPKGSNADVFVLQVRLHFIGENSQ